MMSHKDYVKIAAALAEARDHYATQHDAHAASVELGISLAEGALVGVLAADNPRFDFERFHAAAIGQPLTGRDRPR